MGQGVEESFTNSLGMNSLIFYSWNEVFYLILKKRSLNFTQDIKRLFYLLKKLSI